MTTQREMIASERPAPRPPFFMEFDGYTVTMNRSRTLVFIGREDGTFVRTMSVYAVLNDYEIGIGATVPAHVKDAVREAAA